MLDHLRRLTEHCLAADASLAAALRAVQSSPAPLVREYAHILGAEEVWLARLESRTARAAIWPEATVGELLPLRDAVVDGYRAYVGRLSADDLGRLIDYRNSAGLTFSNTIADILLHVMLHGQYHRGKVNLLLRQSGLAPVPTDYIAFVRGVPAATLPDATRANR
ncbi:MAG TPA: DinB family protein [Gemmatimonadaceae bacterium]